MIETDGNRDGDFGGYFGEELKDPGIQENIAFYSGETIGGRQWSKDSSIKSLDLLVEITPLNRTTKPTHQTFSPWKKTK